MAPATIDENASHSGIEPAISPSFLQDDLANASVVATNLLFTEGVLSALGARGGVSSDLGPVLQGMTALVGIAAVLGQRGTSVGPTERQPTEATTASTLTGNINELARRLTEIASLKGGWLDGDGEAIDPNVVSFLRSVVIPLASHGPPRVRMYPTPDGGVQLEWSTAKGSLSFEINPDMSAYAVETDDQHGSLMEREYEGVSRVALLALLRGGVA